MPEAVIVATARSPIGRAFKGSLASIRPDDLAAQIVKAVARQGPRARPAPRRGPHHGLRPARRRGRRTTSARVVAVLAGLDDVPGVTVNRYCSSSLQTIRMAAHAIKAGEGDVFIAAGVETVSRFGNGMADDGPHEPRLRRRRGPHRRARRGRRRRRGPRRAGLPDVYIAMGQTAENVAQYENVSREDQDEFAARSQQRATASLERGFWEDEITPVTLPDGTVVSAPTTASAPAPPSRSCHSSSPVFRPDGTVTAGNACPLNDGAAAVIVMTDTKAAELGLTPLARVVSSGVTGLNPEIMGLGPIEAIRQALGRAGMTIDDIDLVEINEAFAAQVVPSAKHLGISYDKLNVNGGAIALGHPFGMTGARIMTTLIHGLQDADKTFGIETMCVGGGQGMAMIVERLG